LRHLAGVVAIADIGSLSAAADAISLSQPALTQGVAKIEGDIGLPLFWRTSGGMRITEAGETYVARVRRGLALLDRSGWPAERPRVWKALSHAQLTALVAAVDHLGFRAAARQMGREVSTVSRSLRAAERRANAPLFEMTSRGMRPTRLGESLANAARLALAEFQQARTDLADWQGHFSGRLNVGCLPLAQTAVLPRAIDAFSDAFPKVEIRVVDGAYQPLVRALLRGEIDVLIGALREGAVPDGVEETLVLHDPLWVVARSGHPLGARSDLCLADLAGHAWIAPRVGAPARVHFDALVGRLDFGDEIAMPVEMGAPALLQAMLRDSDRLTLISRMQVAEAVAMGHLCRIEVDLGPTGRAIGYTTRADWQPSMPQQRFLDILNVEFEAMDRAMG